MVGMYDDINEDISENIEIDGYPFYAENISANEPYNRRETNRQPIIGGTEHVSRGKYVVRDYSFSTTIFVPDDRPDVHDNIFREMVSKQCEVISPSMGGKFMAEIKIEKDFEEASPNHIKYDFQVIEVPGTESLIPGDTFIIPEDVLQNEESENKTSVSTVEKETTQKKKSKEDILNELREKLKSRSR